jgi:hypothetical protein
VFAALYFKNMKILRYTLIPLIILLAGCIDRVTINSDSEASYDMSLSEMKQGLSEGETLQLNFALIVIGISAIPRASDWQVKMEDPKKYTMRMIDGKSRRGIINLAKKISDDGVFKSRKIQ